MRLARMLSWLALFLSAAIGIAHYPMLLSGFEVIEGDLYDARFFHYVLEHGWKWLTGASHHEALWSPPFFFPARNAAAYSEILLSAAPPYFLARSLGFDAWSAYQLWLTAVTVLNFGAMAILARQALAASWLASGFAGALFAAAGPRLSEARFGHYQLYPEFWTVLALLAIVRATLARSEWRRAAWALSAGPLFALQFWSSFYLGWFAAALLCFSLAFAALLTDLVPTLWKERRVTLAYLAGAALGGLLLAPLASPYLEAAHTMGVRSFGEMMVVKPARWLYLGDSSWLYGFLAHPFFAHTGIASGQALSLGPVSTLVVGLGLFWGRRRRMLLMLTLGGVLLALFTMRFGDFFPWKILYDWVPGAAALRAVSRAVLLVLIPLALCAAVTIDRLASRRPAGRLAAASLGLFCLVEQGKHLPSFEMAENRALIREIAAAVEPSRCDAFLYMPRAQTHRAWKYSLDAMWAQIESGVPTINGATTFEPDGWNLEDTRVGFPADRRRIEGALAQWVEQNGLEASRVCRVEIRPHAQELRGQSIAPAAAEQRRSPALPRRPPELSPRPALAAGSVADGRSFAHRRSSHTSPGSDITGRSRTSLHAKVTARSPHPHGFSPGS